MSDFDTIAHVLHSSFKDSDTRVTERVVALSSKYINLFINEAIIRANLERVLEGDVNVDGIDNVGKESDGESESGDSVNSFDIDTNVSTNDTLDSRHLKKIGGVLLMDF